MTSSIKSFPLVPIAKWIYQPDIIAQGPTTFTERIHVPLFSIVADPLLTMILDLVYKHMHTNHGWWGEEFSATSHSPQMLTLGVASQNRCGFHSIVTPYRLSKKPPKKQNCSVCEIKHDSRRSWTREQIWRTSWEQRLAAWSKPLHPQYSLTISCWLKQKNWGKKIPSSLKNYWSTLVVTYSIIIRISQ